MGLPIFSLILKELGHSEIDLDAIVLKIIRGIARVVTLESLTYGALSAKEEKKSDFATQDVASFIYLTFGILPPGLWQYSRVSNHKKSEYDHCLNLRKKYKTKI